MFEVFATPEEIRLEVEPMPTLDSGSDMVTLLVRGDTTNGKVMFDTDGAEELADRLTTAAAEAAEGDK